jgi:3-oxoacyl-[acyl-carrier protein] reductase
MGFFEKIGLKKTKKNEGKQERSALITGASRGIGKQIAIQLASEGINIAINYNSSTELAENLAKELRTKYGVKCLVVQADVSNFEQVDKMIEQILNEFGRIDYLVNNAGICVDMDVQDRTVGQFAKTFQINTFSVYNLCKTIGSVMKKNGFGKIVNVSSNNSLNCFYPTTIDYDASKCAVNSLTRNFAIEFAPEVNVNAVAPGWVDTDMNKDVLTEDIKPLEAGRILKRRIGMPQDVANLVSFLLSDKSDYITGQIIAVDGGMF